jgi:uncharacterized RDD family membrane protein YckC
MSDAPDAKMVGNATVAPAGLGEAAGLGRRFTALFIDLLVLALPCALVATVFFSVYVLPALRQAQGGRAAAGGAERFLFHDYFPAVGALQLLEATLAFAYFGASHWLFGCTVGKRAMRMQVVGGAGRRIGFWRAFGRAAALAYPPILGSLGFLSFRVASVGVASILFMILTLVGVGWLIGELASAAADAVGRRCLHDRLARTQVVADGGRRG